MDITLHLGAHRTATTSFQAYLTQNRKKLRDHGLVCWTPKQTRDGRMEGLFRRPSKMTPLNKKAAQRSIGRLKLALASLEQQGARELLISEENLIGTMRCCTAGVALYPDASARLRRALPAFGTQLSGLAVTIRSYETYWASVYARLVLQGTAFPQEDQLDALVTQPRRWRHVVEDIAKACPDVPLKIFAFERIAGRPERVLANLVPSLPHLPRAGARVWHNARHPVPALRKIAEERDHDSAIPLGKLGRKWHPFNDLQSDALRDQYQEDLSWLRSGADGLARLVEDREQMDVSQGGRLHRRRAGGERQRSDGKQSAIAGALA